MKLLLDRPGHRAFLLGNEAIVRGALEAGLEAATGYPGTPSTEVADNLFAISRRTDLSFEYSVNEKVALEVAIGAADMGLKALCTMKDAGLNVAADPLSSASTIGVEGALVILTAGEPSMHSSLNELDARLYARLTLLPMLEPSSPAEALAVTRAAFVLSHELRLPVLLRTTTRVNHSRGVCTFGELTPRRFEGRFEKDVRRWAPVPVFARALRVKQLEHLPVRLACMRALGFDRVEGAGEIGIVTSGVSYLYVKELLDELGAADRVRVAKLTSLFPFPRYLIEELAATCREILVVEEGEPYVETEVRALLQEIGATVRVHGKGEDWIPRHFELSPDRIRPVIARFSGVEFPARVVVQVPPLPARPPMLCAGCTHRTSYYAVKSVADTDPETIFVSDIGCYTLGLMPPLNAADTFVCMGSSPAQSSGMGIRSDQPRVAFIGDATFFHSGMTGLVNAVHNRHDLLLVILDNSTTAMTGHQPHPASELDPELMRGVDIERAVRGLGVDDLRVVDPTDLDTTIREVQGAFGRKGVRVIISRAPCPLFARRLTGPPLEPLIYEVDHERCRRCGHHLDHEPCGVPADKVDQILRARTKILAAGLGPLDYPAVGRARKSVSPPCTFACPANICAFGYLSLARAGRFDQALALIRESVPLPGVLGHVCHRPCESACVRGDTDEPISINGAKRFLAERETAAQRAGYFSALAERCDGRDTGRKVAVVGSGPAGLAAAWELRLRGHHVTVFERERRAGGLLRSGIPPYRLPREILDREIDALLSLGIELRTAQALGRDFTVQGLLEDRGFDAVCLAIGAHQGLRLAVQGEEAEGIEEALWFLRRVFVDGEKAVGRQVLVVGGGDAAVDAARTAWRLGARQVRIAYRRTLDEMPAAREELDAARAEGIEIVCQAVPVGFDKDGSRVRAVRLVRTEPGAPDGSGRRLPVPVPDSETTEIADHVIVAIGQTVEPEALGGGPELGRDRRGLLPADPRTGATSNPRVFAAGDLTGRGWTVIDAIAQGRLAAQGIDRTLRGEEAAAAFALHRSAELDEAQRYHPPAVEPAPRRTAPELDAATRVAGFDLVTGTLSVEQVQEETERCLSCGQCARCNNCIDNFGCPAIYQRDGRVYIDDVLCVGCGVCAQLCPNDAIVPSPVAGKARA
ncbi:MAG TPA: FAD-dependent oxidoreductase [Polyangia bacterium]|nr:FAD-dependent oxidoreductase [Polyangia bacterium]